MNAIVAKQCLLWRHCIINRVWIWIAS